jgi:hypothetical protein
MTLKRLWLSALFVAFAVTAQVPSLFAQTDQGTITGVIQDPSGAVIGNAEVTLTNTDLGQILRSRSDAAGVYVFSPVKIGNYKLTVSAPGFETTTQANLHLSLQQRLNVTVMLQPGAATETVTVTSEAPLMQTQESSVGQTMDTQTINSIPLNGRNWLYVAQLAAGADPPEGSRGAGKGDFNANGQRAEQNNFILDGIDNNVNVVDFYNGASFVVQPPPDALAEMKVQTSDYSAEFGHSAGAVVNASIKSGSNNFHGSLWEYLRNTAFDIHDWDAEALPVPGYHENQFGATLGGPIFRNKLFLFGDAQANRIRSSETTTETVPDTLERAGDFSELLNANLTGSAPVQLYRQSANAPPVAIANNCLVTSQYCTNSQGLGITLNPTAQKMLSYYPQPSGNPNAAAGLLYNNLTEQRPVVDDTFQWDLRADWTIGAKDTAYARHSYWNEVGLHVPPLGNILDGGGFGDDGPQKYLGQSFMTSETHVFTQTLTNEARFGFTYLHTGFEQPNAADLGFAAAQGFGGIPSAPLNGGLPYVAFSSSNSTSSASGAGGISNLGSPEWAATDEHENVFEIIDNVTKIKGNHALKAGVSFESIRFSTLQPQQSRGSYNYNGEYTSNLNAPNTGYGVADFLLDMQNSAGLSNEVTNGDARWDNAVYFQDDWRLNPKLALNLGLRWEHFQPYQDVGGYQASYNMTGPPSLNTTTGFGSGQAQYQIPSEAKGYAAPIMAQYGFTSVLAKDNIALVYTGDPHIVKSQYTNFAPRIGVSFSPDSRTTLRAGFGIFYGGLESTGYFPNLGENYPFQYAANFPAASCGTFNCPTDGITIANGFASIVANGFASDVEDLTLRGSDPTAKTPYTEDYNLTIERGIGNDTAATLSYVGNVSRHLQVFPDPNGPLAYENPANSIQDARPLPDFGSSSYTAYAGESNYNALQAKLEKRMAHGYNLLATYTWSHALDDAPTPLGSTGDAGYRESNLIPTKLDYSNSPFDTRQRITFNALYQVPFGIGRTYLNTNRALDYLIGGWSTNVLWVAQTGNPFSVYPSGISSPSGAGIGSGTGSNGGDRAIKIKDPFATGGTFQSPNPSLASGINCAASTKNHAHWFNPCSFENPWDADDKTYEPDHYIPKSASDPNTPAGDSTPVYVTNLSTVLAYSGGVRDQVVGPGYERLNMSVFKDIKAFHEQYFTFRTDIFNLFNTPSYGQPNNTNINSQGGAITGPRALQNDAPDSRFFQLSMSYHF